MRDGEVFNPTSEEGEAAAYATPVIDRDRRRGRGALSNVSSRFDAAVSEAFDDGWESLAELDAFKTEVREDAARTIITRNNSPDISFDRSINPYRGCEHGCVYCFARPNHSYLGLSPGTDFERRLFAKVNAAELLVETLAAPGYRHAGATVLDLFPPTPHVEVVTRFDR